MRLVAAIVVALSLSGCASVNYIAETYGLDAQPVSVAMGDDTYRVFDRPDKGLMMVTSSIGASAGQGLQKGLLFVDGTPPKPRFQAAAERHLATTGRSACRITDGYLVISPQWEFRYACPATKAGRRA